MTLAGVVAESFPKAERYLWELADIKASAQRIRRITLLRGKERIAVRQQLTQYYCDASIPDQLHRVPDGVSSPTIAAISFDGGRYQLLDRSELATIARMQQRQMGLRRKGEHWKESRVACVMSMSGSVHDVDPMPELPTFLAGGVELQRKLAEIGHVMALPSSALQDDGQQEQTPQPKSPRRSRKNPLAIDERPLPGPELVQRDVVASADCWAEFGQSVAAEAWLKGFAGAERKVCICDGNDAIRRVCETHFSNYVHVLDLMHALGYAMNAARAIGGNSNEINERYRRWAEQIWRGEVGLVIAELDRHQARLGQAPKDAGADDPREAVRRTRVYYTNQRSRMDYPAYRRQGFPLTSSLMESAVKQIGRRVKGSEKFWSASGGAGMLALRGDLISDGDRLTTFLAQFAAPADGTRVYATAA